MLKHSGSATRLGADSPDERGRVGANGRERGKYYLVMARMKVAMDMSIEVMVKKMLVEELKKALRA